MNKPEEHRCIAAVLPLLDAADGEAEFGRLRQIRLGNVELEPLVPPQVVVGGVDNLLRLQDLAESLSAVV